ncbi:TetR/AcrR family transcriptional regulator [Apilactobacillus apisilvae]|uniref:TetR/AcrR family transcriptional regulator n=1 Tax=Apilactobacillus apisilvae TaxID=2923364 RepID=A0ABY4PGX1_9LACO|nr:TetR/AcrR family transcriptional regulator [Apilactobacillus apisilvae]UQS84827.1 TetR/AcrR family transcriptional regulator [Apilactobacillus apisilvae]
MAKYELKRQKTQSKIINNTIKIAKIKGLERVTVSDIIKSSNINRSTFYRHFEDKYQLIDVIEKSIIDKINSEYKIFENDNFGNLKEHNTGTEVIILNR